MATGDGKFEDNAIRKVDLNAQQTGEALLADSQPNPPARPTDSQAKAVDATTPVTDTAAAIGDKLSADVTANLQASSQAKIDRLCSTDDGRTLLTQNHACGQNVMQQLETLYPEAYRHAGLDRSYNS